MFGFFRRKAEPVSQPASKAQPAAAPSNAFDRIEVIGRCIERFMDHATFIDALDNAPGFRAQVMPNGMQVAASAEKKIGVVLDQAMVGISAAGVGATQMALVSASGYFENFQKHEPAWQVSDMPDGSQKLHVHVPFGVRNIIEMTCHEGPVDTQFNGRNEPGCTLMITVRPKS